MVITESIVEQIIEEMKHTKNLDYLKTRKIVNTKVAIDDVIPVKLWPVMFKIRRRMYNPNDTGKDGKETEVKDRLSLWRDSGIQETCWKEFSAHAANEADITDPDSGEDWDIKTTVAGGDFLSSPTAHTVEEIIAEFMEKTDYVCYKNEEFGFNIFCMWKELLQYLSAYNGKGLSTWIRMDKVRYNAATGRFVLCMQTVRSSNKKLNYLKAWKGESR